MSIPRSDSQPNMNTPLVTITFEPPPLLDTASAAAETRHWYHVPRVGDVVALTEDCAGKVAAVEWRDDGVVVTLA